MGAARVPPEVVWSRNDRVVIQLRIGETERAVDEIEAALIDSDRGLYRRGGLIVSTGFDQMQTWDGRKIEVQIIEERSNYALLEDIEAVASFERYNPKTEKRTKVPPPMALANTLKQRTTRLRLPNLVSVINCPTIKANGELITEPGFYPDIGILYDPRGVKFPLAPPQPGKAVAMTALARIMRLIEHVRFRQHRRQGGGAVAHPHRHRAAMPAHRAAARLRRAGRRFRQIEAGGHRQHPRHRP